MNCNNQLLYARLRILFIIADKSYVIYKNHNYKYIFAKNIFKINKIIYATIINNLENFDNDNIFELVIHLNNWFTQFELLENKLENKLNEEIVFRFERIDGDMPYPKDFINSIIKKQINE